METKRRALISSDVRMPVPSAREFCCDDCGDLCRELIEVMTPTEFRSFMAANRETSPSMTQVAVKGQLRSGAPVLN